ncbi:MAG: hypothetical protein D3926_21280 [Desulfobacteraceae bacterium]|nr:MAG: hypothetical protein D3926_21280 [Desulfobacteraceae bacterium]
MKSFKLESSDKELYRIFMKNAIHSGSNGHNFKILFFTAHFRKKSLTRISDYGRLAVMIHSVYCSDEYPIYHKNRLGKIDYHGQIGPDL